MLYQINVGPNQIDMNTFVWCSEDKVSQKNRFEKFWASGFKSKNDYLNKLASKGSKCNLFIKFKPRSLR